MEAPTNIETRLPVAQAAIAIMVAAASCTLQQPSACCGPTCWIQKPTAMIPATRRITQNQRAPASNAINEFNQRRSTRDDKYLNAPLLHLFKSSTTTASRLQLLLFIFALLFVSHFGCATATPVPSISTSSGEFSVHISSSPVRATTPADT